MNFRRLRYFVEIAASGSLREASVKLHIAQPALTRHLRMLEDELGVKLCSRHARGIKLTPAGYRLLEHATSVLRQVSEISSRISEDLESPSGIVTIGASGAMSRLLFGAVAQKIAQEYPRINLRMVEGGAYTLLAALDAKRVDLAVMINPEVRSGFISDRLVTEPVFLIGSSGDKRLTTSEIDITQMESYPLVSFGRPSGPRIMYDYEAAKAGVSLNIAYEVESLEVIKDFVKRRLAFALLPHSSIFEEINSSTFKAARLRDIGITRSLVIREDIAGNPVVESVANIVREEFNALSSEGVFYAH